LASLASSPAQFEKTNPAIIKTAILIIGIMIVFLEVCFCIIVKLMEVLHTVVAIILSQDQTCQSVLL